MYEQMTCPECGGSGIDPVDDLESCQLCDGEGLIPKPDDWDEEYA